MIDPKSLNALDTRIRRWRAKFGWLRSEAIYCKNTGREFARADQKLMWPRPCNTDGSDCMTPEFMQGAAWAFERASVELDCDVDWMRRNAVVDEAIKLASAEGGR